MHRLKTMGLPLPEVYVCRTRSEAVEIADAGIPYLISKLDDLEIVKLVMFRVLKKKFPHIDWKKTLGIKQVKSLIVMVPGSDQMDEEATETEEPAPVPEQPETPDIEDPVDSEEDEDNEEYLDPESRMVTAVAEDYRYFSGSEYGCSTPVKLEDFCMDEAAHVNIEQLQALGFLPKFMDDAADAIRINLEDRIRWRECYNKRLGCCVGDVDFGYEAPNLIILDVSASIPEGISATMLQLIATLRDQANADLIVTGGKSFYWSNDDELPDPERIRKMVPRGNECDMFMKILAENISGRHFGNVISFGDYDAPETFAFHYRNQYKDFSMPGTQVDRVLHYHTYHPTRTGYAKWVHEICPDAEEVYDTEWCRVMI